jgi:predicted dienelactone hydrolase
MRAFEILLTLANFLALLNLATSKIQTLRWIGYILPIALLIALTQVIVEGPRWQMTPAYILAICFFLIWLIGTILVGGWRINRLVSIFALGIGILVFVISIALPVLLPVFHFPKPTGPYAIGTVTYHWVDSSRPELFAPDPSDHRELTAQIWYPAKNEPSAPRAPYISDAGAVTPAIGQLIHLPGFVFSHLKYVTTNAVTNAPIADDKPSYPVLIDLTGVDGFRSVSTFQIEALVSHGYIVVGLDQPGIAPSIQFSNGQRILGWPRDKIQPFINQSAEPQQKAPMLDGKPLPEGIIPYFAQDASFALDQLTKINQSSPSHFLTGRIDLNHVGTFGVSLGGMDAAEACRKDARFKACLIMDVNLPADVVKYGLQQPTLFITRDANTMHLEHKANGTWSDHDITLTLTTMRAVYDHLPGAGYYVQIPGMFHVNFTDLPYWSPVLPQIGMTGPIDRQHGFDIINAYSVAFFDRELKGHSSPLLAGSSKQYPEVIFDARLTN